MNYKKVLALGISLTCLSFTPLYAAEVTAIEAVIEKPALTLEEAIKSALSNSSKLSLNMQKDEVLTEQLKYTNNLISSAYMNLYTSKQQNEQQRQFLEDQIAHDVTTR